MAIVKRATEDDWYDVRVVRLSALADSPSAFGASFEQEKGFSEADWRQWASPGPIFIARAGGAPIGMAAAFPGDLEDERRLVALWVHPNHRGSGVASSLVSHVEDWARQDGAERLTLWVAENNVSARYLYQAHGFQASERRKPLPSNPEVEEERMSLTLR